MAALESYSVKPSDLSPVTIRALDTNHLDLILSDLFRNGWWKGLEDKAPVEIRTPEGKVSKTLAKSFR